MKNAVDTFHGLLNHRVVADIAFDDFNLRGNFLEIASMSGAKIIKDANAMPGSSIASAERNSAASASRRSLSTTTKRHGDNIP